MKTIIGMISCAVVAAAAPACHNDNPPPTTPSTYTESTTTTTAYQPSYEQPRPAEPPSSTTSDQTTGNSAMKTIGTEEANQEPMVKGAPATPIDPSLENNDPGASARPVTGARPTESSSVDANNAKQAADKDKNEKKPGVTDQGNSKAEVKISARIRKSLMASSSLSFGAKNVKIITEGSKVTLRGDVKSEAERKEIVGIARNTDGVKQVDDQLVVKP